MEFGSQLKFLWKKASDMAVTSVKLLQGWTRSTKMQFWEFSLMIMPPRMIASDNWTSKFRDGEIHKNKLVNSSFSLINTQVTWQDFLSTWMGTTRHTSLTGLHKECISRCCMVITTTLPTRIILSGIGHIWRKMSTKGMRSSSLICGNAENKDPQTHKMLRLLSNSSSSFQLSLSDLLRCYFKISNLVGYAFIFYIKTKDLIFITNL